MSLVSYISHLTWLWIFIARGTCFLCVNKLKGSWGKDNLFNKLQTCTKSTFAGIWSYCDTLCQLYSMFNTTFMSAQVGRYKFWHLPFKNYHVCWFRFKGLYLTFVEVTSVWIKKWNCRIIFTVVDSEPGIIPCPAWLFIVMWSWASVMFCV